MGRLTSFLLFLLTFVCASTAGGAKGRRSGRVSQPSLYQSPRFRWWWPGGWIEPDEITDEVAAIVDAGFGGAEIADVEDSVLTQLDPKVYGWAQPRWNTAVLRAYQEAHKLGAHLDLTLGPHWPTGFPGYTPDSPGTSKELVHGQIFVQAGQTFSGTLPQPVVAPSGNMTGNIVEATPFLAAVIVARTSTTNENASVVDFDPSTVRVITGLVSNDTVTWTAPSNGTYVLVAAYGRGTGQIQNMYDAHLNVPELTYPFPAYIVDHFSSAGVEAGIKYWNEHILTSELRDLLQRSEGSIFEDSLELKKTQYWTLNFLKEFQKRRGYDLTPFLLYVIEDTNTFSGDDTVSTKITNDFYQTVSDLYVDYRVRGLKSWANSLGLKLRIQPYTASFDSAYAASIVDIPEGESLGFEGDNDAFRVLATGRDIASKTTILSDELGAYMGKAYGVTWKFILGTANHDMSLGVSQVVIHGFPYRDSPTSVWPGYAPFTPLGTSSNGFADAWGPREPQWIFAKNASTYLANAQKLLQDGGPSIDVAILNQDWGVTAKYEDTSLNDAGYSYQFPTPELLSKYKVEVESGHLAPQGPKYKALIVNGLNMTDVSTAKKLLSYAEKGLPIVLVGLVPNTTYSYSLQQTADDAELSTVFFQIRNLSTTKLVGSTTEVPSALNGLGVLPSVQYPQGINNTLITLRRTVDTGYLYWVYNDGDNTVKETVKFEGDGSPFIVDLWTGDVKPIASFTTSEEGYIAVNLTLTSTASVAIYIGPTNPFGAPTLSNHIVSTDCQSYVKGSTIYLLSNVTCSATTSAGKETALSPDQVPQPVSPTSWRLEVQDWEPAQINETGLNSSRTIKKDLAPINLTALVPWPDIASLEYASGIGVYTTSVSLTKKSNDTRILLDVGSVEGTWGLRINGRAVHGVDLFNRAPLDVTDLVVDGTNVIEVKVATTLWNKLIKVWPAIYGSLEPQQTGLIGPVTFIYMRDIVV